MQGLEDIVRSENANSALAFRETAYGESELEALATDVLALANANVAGPRFLILGVRDVVGGERKLMGISKPDLVRVKRHLGILLAHAVEPVIAASVSTLETDKVLIGIICLGNCDDPPYLLSKPLGDRLPAGIGFIRRGSSSAPLLRADLRRMFEQRAASPSSEIVLRVGFPGPELCDEIALPVLDLPELPSKVAAAQLHALLKMKRNARDMLGHTETRLSRLMHAKLFGPEAPFEALSDDSLKMRIDRSVEDFHDADEHYRYEVRAHKINLAVRNECELDLHDASVQMTVQRIEGVGVAERLYREDGHENLGDRYPIVTLGPRTITLESSVGTVSRGQTIDAFREPPRLWLRRPAAGKSIAVDYRLRARELKEPIADTLLIHVEKIAS